MLFSKFIFLKVWALATVVPMSFIFGFEALAESGDGGKSGIGEIPQPDFTHPYVEPNYKKLWGKRYKLGVHSLHWNPSKGWKGLVPYKSHLADAEKKFGRAKYVHKEFSVLKTYTFGNGVTVQANDTDHIISFIEVSVSETYTSDFPLTTHDAEIMYSPIKRRLLLEGCTTDPILIRPGLKIELTYDGKVSRLQFSDPKSDTSK